MLSGTVGPSLPARAQAIIQTPGLGAPPKRMGALKLRERPTERGTGGDSPRILDIRGSPISVVHFERTAHPGPLGGVSADQRQNVVRGGVEPPTFRFSGQPRSALCRPAKTDVTEKQNRARRKVRQLGQQDPVHASTRQDSGSAQATGKGTCPSRDTPRDRRRQSPQGLVRFALPSSLRRLGATV